MFSVTNVMPAMLNLRLVDGKEYDSDTHKLWQNKQGEVLEILTNGIIVQSFTLQSPPQQFVIEDNKVSRRGGPDTKIPGPTIFIQNYPTQPSDEIKCRAMKTGKQITWQGAKIECWDHGLYARATQIISRRKEIVP